MLKSGVSAALVLAAAGSDHRLEIVNGCGSEPLWVAHIVSGQVGPDSQDNKILPGQSRTFYTSKNGAGLSATRFWPKMGCDATGGNCAIGSSGGPGEECVIHQSWGDDYSHCAPPVDSKFEASFAPTDNPLIDVVDMSLVDGFSLPFKLEVSGGSCNRHQYAGGPAEAFNGMDCSGLSLDQCPTGEILNGQAKSLQAINPKNGKVSGCYSPCTRLVDDKWQKSGAVAPDSTEAGPYCCAGADGTPGVCNAGPILQTQYVKMSKSKCPAAYSYAYDDKTATIICTTTTQYKVTFFCPSGGVSPSPPSPPGPTPSPPAPSPAFNPCSSTSTACCNPNTSPKQLCPGGAECQACGGGAACECPRADVMV